MLGMELQTLLVGFDGPPDGFRLIGVVEALDVVPLASGQPVRPLQRFPGVLVAFLECGEIAVVHRELRVGHREIRIDRDSLLEERYGLSEQSAFVEVDPLRIITVCLD
jgi:hypothetical protein